MKTKNYSRFPLHVSLMGLLFLLAPSIGNAQDKMILYSGEELSVKITQVSDYEIMYKNENDSTGPLRSISKSRVFSITYPNGTKDVFEHTVNGVPQKNAIKPGSASSNEDDFVPEHIKKFGGPRLGLTFITPGTLTDHLDDLGKRPMITQIGWQFEKRIFTIEDGTSGLVEFIPLLGGMEQGLFLPSANLLFGLRSGGKRSIEFAVGPNASFSGLGMVFAAGCNFRSGAINFPVNIAVVPSVGSKKNEYDPKTNTTYARYYQTGWRITLTVGFNSRKS